MFSTDLVLFVRCPVSSCGCVQLSSFLGSTWAQYRTYTAPFGTVTSTFISDGLELVFGVFLFRHYVYFTVDAFHF